MTAAVERDSISTAAAYVNNCLLARGLLRNGKPVDFCSLATDGDKKRSKEPKSNTTAQIINLVHDLILRRDTDQARIESLAATLATLNTSNDRLTIDLERAQEQNRELRRKANALEQSERNAQVAIQSAEASAKQLRDEVQKTKTVLSQVRTQCSNDLRKRDVEMTKLKTHLSTQQRGTAARSTVSSSANGPQCTIATGRTPRTRVRKRDEMSPSLEDATYSLKQETTDFLTQLSQGLSDENDALITLAKGTIDTLRNLMGLSHNRAAQVSGGDESSMGSTPGWSADGMVFTPPTSYSELTRDMEIVLSNLRDLLTNPSFAPIEEVHVREEEIQRLRQGWELMESRWQEAVTMMSKWTTRMQNGGDSVNVAELKAGLRLGEGLRRLNEMSPSPARTLDYEDDPAASEEEEEEQDETEGSSVDSSSQCGVEHLPEEESPLKRPEVPLISSSKLGQLTEVNGNVQVHRAAAARKAQQLDGAKEKDRAAETSSSSADGTGAAVKAIAGQRAPGASEGITKGYMRPTATASSRAESRLPTKTRSQSRPEGQKALSVRQKLDLAEQEALRVSSSSPSQASEVAATKNTRSGAGGVVAGDEDEVQEAEDAELLLAQKPRSQIKRARISGKPRRRKSTLTPGELEELMLGGSQ